MKSDSTIVNRGQWGMGRGGVRVLRTMGGNRRGGGERVKGEKALKRETACEQAIHVRAS